MLAMLPAGKRVVAGQVAQGGAGGVGDASRSGAFGHRLGVQGLRCLRAGGRGASKTSLLSRQARGGLLARLSTGARLVAGEVAQGMAAGVKGAARGRRGRPRRRRLLFPGYAGGEAAATGRDAATGGREARRPAWPRAEDLCLGRDVFVQPRVPGDRVAFGQRAFGATGRPRMLRHRRHAGGAEGLCGGLLRRRALVPPGALRRAKWFRQGPRHPGGARQAAAQAGVRSVGRHLHHRRGRSRSC
mmetsp:Transcript_49117/g.142988  ORF Transcript_49117/g.142988 Transcript_49117/m.142988 type:complete len:244 (-) Transcript_49117:651-1382(-)